MSRVLVTGGTGYVGAWCTKLLLDAGHDVTTTIRDDSREQAVRNAVGDKRGRLRVVCADLAADAGWDMATEQCEFVLHVASPLDADGENEQTMVSQARDGTLRVLNAAEHSGVGRVVLTSSSAAAMPEFPQLTGMVDEETWTDPTDERIGAYRRSKILAEQAAWEWSTHLEVELVTILPTAVFGPGLSSSSLSSLRIVSSLLDGSAIALPRLGFEVVDVRDVARAHLLAMETSAAAGHRFCVAGEMLWFGEIAELLRANLGAAAAAVPTVALSDDDFRALAEGNEELQGVLPSLGREVRHSTAKARELLGWEPRPVEQTIVESARFLIDAAV